MQNNLEKQRLKIGLKQSEVAQRLGIAESSYQNYERGRVNPSVQRAIELAKALECTVEDLYDKIIP
jgi:putative transcriptional regulator